MVDKLTMDLKQKFKEEDNCIQVALSNLQVVDKSNLSEALKKVQRYTLNEKKTKHIEKKEKIKVEKRKTEMRKITESLRTVMKKRGKCLWSSLKGLN